ncbi:hypothetical protein BGX29_002381 [Mortierella sp. GBA35]|nr:hypothetical protein BGX29_002381 [Mortierella sp. GBA35]
MLSHKRGPIPREELDPEARQAAIDHASGRQVAKPKPTRNTGPLQLTHYGNLRPRFITFRTLYPLNHSYFGSSTFGDDPIRRLCEEGHIAAIEASTLRPASARGDLWRKEITDHLVEVFFEHCFQDFDNFDPKEFLKDYIERKVNPSLLNSICAVAARFSDHPDIVQAPPYLAGEPYAEKTREKIMDLIDEATISNLHALSILSFYEYSAWSGPRGWRFGGLASRMGIELYLHNQRDVPNSESARVKFETKCRTFWNLIHIDIFSAASAGLPSILDVKLYNIQLPDHRPDWWVEKYHELEAAIIGELQEDSDLQETISTQAETTPNDSFISGILTKLQEPRRLRGHGPAKHLFEPIEILFRVSQYINGNTLESDRCPSDPSSEFAVLEGRLLTWFKNIEEEMPVTPAGIFESEDHVVYMFLTYYMTIIMLHRPIIALEGVVNAAFLKQSRIRCADAATKVTEIVELLSEKDIKYRGHIYLFQVFSAAAIHVTNIFSSDAGLASNAKRCLNVHLNFLKVSSPHWTVSARLYYVLQDLYTSQPTVHTSIVASSSASAPASASAPTSAPLEDHDIAGYESRSDRAQSSATPPLTTREAVHIDLISGQQEYTDSDSTTTKKRTHELSSSITPLDISASAYGTGFDYLGDTGSDRSTAQGSTRTGTDDDEEADDGVADTLADGSSRRPKKARVSRPILPRPLSLDSNATLHPPAGLSALMVPESAPTATTMISIQNPESSVMATSVYTIPPGHFPPSLPPPTQIPGYSDRQQPATPLLHSLDVTPPVLPDLDFNDPLGFHEPMAALPRHHNSLNRGQEYQPRPAVYQRNISEMTAVPTVRNSSFHAYGQDKSYGLSIPGRTSMPFDPPPAISSVRGYLTQSYPQLDIGADGYPVFGAHRPGGLQASEGEGGFGAGMTGHDWAMDQDAMFGGRGTTWPAGVVQERSVIREDLIEYQRLQDKQQEYMSTRFMRHASLDPGTIQPPLMLGLNSQQGGYGGHGGVHLYVETSSAGLAPFGHQQQPPPPQAPILPHHQQHQHQHHHHSSKRHHRHQYRRNNIIINMGMTSKEAARDPITNSALM